MIQTQDMDFLSLTLSISHVWRYGTQRQAKGRKAQIPQSRIATLEF